MKKIVSIMLCFCLSILFIIPSFAYFVEATSDDAIIDYDEITDLEILYERALNNVNDISDEMNETLSENAVIIVDALEMELDDPLITTQLLSERIIDGEVVESTYATTIIAGLFVEEDEYGHMLLMADEELTKTGKKQSSSDIIVYVTMTLVESTTGGYQTLKMTKVSGTYERLDTTCRVSNQQVYAKWQGDSYPNGWAQGNTGWVSGSSKTITNCPTFIKGSIMNSFYSAYSLDLSRGNQTWEVSVDIYW